MIHSYLHKVHYYETDKMGVVHHSNYIRWMEEARVALLDQLGLSFAGMEARGLLSPVVAVDCRYLRPCRFDELVEIRTAITEFKGVRLVVGYEFFNRGTGQLAAAGSSQHCFTDASGRPVVLKKNHPDIDAALRAAVQKPSP
ncbi:MAG: acyl-CoA thioesterase [Oscillospiraceae bacterium]|nr:acyl-CoA thioesterase [Oscillospiraceae bacterium]